MTFRTCCVSIKAFAANDDDSINESKLPKSVYALFNG